MSLYWAATRCFETERAFRLIMSEVLAEEQCIMQDWHTVYACLLDGLAMAKSDGFTRVTRLGDWRLKEEHNPFPVTCSPKSRNPRQLATKVP